MSLTLNKPAAPTAAAPTSGAAPVTFTDISKTFNGNGAPTRVLKDVNFEVRPGEIVALLGASGCGKSTLLRAIAGLDSPTTGTITIGDEAASGLSERCAVAFQEPRLLPWRSIAQNVILGLPRNNGKAKKKPSAEASAQVAKLLELVGLSHAADLRPREVSGGMAQRASLARALARQPEVLLLDEPFGALDALTRLKMQELLLQIHRAQPTTTIMVTHDVDEAIQLADRIIVLGRPDGATTGAATVQENIELDLPQPRDRTDETIAPRLAALRSHLLKSLGVDPHQH